VKRALVVLTAALLLVSCNSSDGSESTYFILKDASWRLREALNPAAGKAFPIEKSVDWYAEYERYPKPDVTQGVRLSAHDTLGLKRDLAKVKIKYRATKIRGGRGFLGSGPEKKGPEIVWFEAKPGYAIMALSYDLDSKELIAWTAKLAPASEKDWVARGGAAPTSGAP
jgi:hypothetical protein